MSLPSAYQEVEYIESSGTQYIDTWYIITPNTEVSADFQFTSTSSQAMVFWIWQDSNTSSWINFNVYIAGASVWSAWLSDWTTSSSWNNTSVSANTNRNKFVLNNWTFKIYDSGWTLINTTNTNTTISRNATHSFWIFARRETYYSAFRNFSSWKLYWLQIKENWTLTKDLVPCYRKSDDVIWLYDLVNDTFYTNSWTWIFTKWPDVIAEWYVISRILWWWPGEFYNQWPCPDWYHVPTSTELSYIWSMLQTYTGSSSYSNLLSIYKMPLAWMWEDWWWTYWMWSAANYYTCSTNWANAIRFFYNSSGVSPTATINREYAFPIRAFKNEPVEPNWSWWTRLAVWDVTTHWEWIWWNSDLWLITIVEYSSWTHYYTTIADKNVWATTVYSSWATLSQDNCWNYFQWWNNYWFPFSGSITTSSTKIDASDYWPTNPYESSTFITWWWDWSTVQNDNLWWKDNAGTAISKQRLIWGTEPPPPFTPVTVEYLFPWKNLQTDFVDKWCVVQDYIAIDSNWLTDWTSTNDRYWRLWIPMEWDLSKASSLSITANLYWTSWSWSWPYYFWATSTTNFDDWTRIWWSINFNNNSWYNWQSLDFDRSSVASTNLTIGTWNYVCTLSVDFDTWLFKHEVTWVSSWTLQYTLSESQLNYIKSNLQWIWLQVWHWVYNTKYFTSVSYTIQ